MCFFYSLWNDATISSWFKTLIINKPGLHDAATGTFEPIDAMSVISPTPLSLRIKKGWEPLDSTVLFLQALVTEYRDAESEDDKLQVLANLANFAYDPVNFEYLRQLQVNVFISDMKTDIYLETHDDQVICYC